MHPVLNRNFEVFSALDCLAALAWGGRAGSRRVQAGAVRSEAHPRKANSYHQFLSAMIGDGCRLVLGGMVLQRQPMGVVYELVRRRVRDLTIAAFVGGNPIDLLITRELFR
jgi:hypothetical protein